MALLRRKSNAVPSLRLYYASDVHGSELCWKKFLNASRHYAAGTLIMGGDLTGKALVPIILDNGTAVAHVVGEERTARTDAERAELEQAIRANGFYPLELDSARYEAMRTDADLRDSLFTKAMLDELRRWVSLADERLGETDVAIFVMPGNDDPWTIDEVLETGKAVIPCDDRIVQVGQHEMISCSYSNPTPWDSPRELPEHELYTRIDRLAQQLESSETAIFNLHVPPHDSGLDTAIELDDEFRPVLRAGQPHEIPVGSSAVRELIEQYQPALALHGHIHESRAIARIGRTVVINPGSDYSAGRIDGCVVELAIDGTVRTSQLVSG